MKAHYNRVGNIRPSKEQDDSESSQVSLKAIALGEEASRSMFSSCPIWKKMYSCLLQQLRGHVPGRVNSTREVTLGFSGDIGAALHFTQSRDYASCQSGNACQKRATVLYKKQRFKVVLYKKMRVVCKKSDF